MSTDFYDSRGMSSAFVWWKMAYRTYTSPTERSLPDTFGFFFRVQSASYCGSCRFL